MTDTPRAVGDGFTDDTVAIQAIINQRFGRRDPGCVARWPGCAEGEYNPACCRFPKSCSCGVLND